MLCSNLIKYSFSQTPHRNSVSGKNHGKFKIHKRSDLDPAKMADSKALLAKHSYSNILEENTATLIKQ